MSTPAFPLTPIVAQECVRAMQHGAEVDADLKTALAQVHRRGDCGVRRVRRDSACPFLPPLQRLDDATSAHNEALASVRALEHRCVELEGSNRALSARLQHCQSTTPVAPPAAPSGGAHKAPTAVGVDVANAAERANEEEAEKRRRRQEALAEQRRRELDAALRMRELLSRDD